MPEYSRVASGFGVPYSVIVVFEDANVVIALSASVSLRCSRREWSVSDQGLGPV